MELTLVHRVTITTPDGQVIIEAQPDGTFVEAVQKGKRNLPSCRADFESVSLSLMSESAHKALDQRIKTMQDDASWERVKKLNGLAAENEDEDTENEDED